MATNLCHFWRKQSNNLCNTDTKIYTPIVTLSIKDNAKLLQQSKSDFKRTINWNEYHSKLSIERRNQYLDFLTDPIFQGVNILIVLSFECQ